MKILRQMNFDYEYLLSYFLPHKSVVFDEDYLDEVQDIHFHINDNLHKYLYLFQVKKPFVIFIHRNTTFGTNLYTSTTTTTILFIYYLQHKYLYFKLDKNCFTKNSQESDNTNNLIFLLMIKSPDNLFPVFFL